MLLLKGFIVGIGKIIPGVSGAMLAMSLGIYEDSIKAINNFFKNPIKSSLYLMPIGIGILLAITIFSKIILFLLNNFYLPTMLLFIGLILGGMPMFTKNISKVNIKHLLVILFSFSLVFLISLIGEFNIFTVKESFTMFFVIGFIDAATMVIPGISGTAVMMLLGCYNILLDFFSKLISIDAILNNFSNVFGYGLGLGLCVILLSKLMDYLFKNKREYTYAGILGFALSSVLTLFFETLKNNYNLWEIIIALVLLVIGYNISKRLN